MTVRTFYGDERVSVPGPDGSRLAGTVSGVAGGRVVVALDEATLAFPVGWDEHDQPIPGHIAQILERDLEFFVGGADSTAPSFTPEQLAYLKRTYGDAVEDIATAEAKVAAEARTQDADFAEDEPTADDLAADAAAAVQALGGGLSDEEIAAAKLPDGA